MGYKLKSFLFGIFLSIMLISPVFAQVDVVGSYKFSTEYIYYGEITSIGVGLAVGPYRISHVFTVDENHAANLYTVTFDDTYPDWDKFISQVLKEGSEIVFQIIVGPIGGGSDLIRGLTVSIDDFIVDLNVTITSIVVDPTALILNPGYQTTGSVTWTAYGTPGTTIKYPSGYTPGTTTTPATSPNVSSEGLPSPTNPSSTPYFITGGILLSITGYWLWYRKRT